MAPYPRVVPPCISQRGRRHGTAGGKVMTPVRLLRRPLWREDDLLPVPLAARQFDIVVCAHMLCGAQAIAPSISWTVVLIYLDVHPNQEWGSDADSAGDRRHRVRGEPHPGRAKGLGGNKGCSGVPGPEPLACWDRLGGAGRGSSRPRISAGTGPGDRHGLPCRSLDLGLGSAGGLTPALPGTEPGVDRVGAGRGGTPVCQYQHDQRGGTRGSSGKLGPNGSRDPAAVLAPSLPCHCH